MKDGASGIGQHQVTDFRRSLL